MNMPEEITEEMRQAFFDAKKNYPLYREKESQAGRGWRPLPDYVYRALLDAAPTPPEDEPVAYISAYGLQLAKEREDVSVTVSVTSKTYGSHNIPLYTRPANNGLRKAAQAVKDMFDGWADLEPEEQVIVENLRAALDKEKS